MRAPGVTRLLLRRLLEVIGEPGYAQARLDRMVVLIASNMVAEVCSLYVKRADGSMELFATEGLNREAVHLSIMRPGEGLVGLIASSGRPCNLSDAQQHPAFSYRPETGEEIYHSFLGVPLLRGAVTLGVLVVQNRADRIYSEEEVELLQTTAAVLTGSFEHMMADNVVQSVSKQRQGRPGSKCFISYSSKDELFAKQLRSDLQNFGVACWFAPHDLLIGAKIRSSIDRAIHENERVVLILSANSISSTWVEKEVETAFETEAATGHTILLPIRLDSAILQAAEGWAADIRRQRNIGDFTDWQDRTLYAQSLSRLLRALNV